MLGLIVSNHSIGEFVKGMVNTNGIESGLGLHKLVSTACPITSARSTCNATQRSSQDDSTSDRFNTIDKITTIILSSKRKRLPYQALVGPKHGRQAALIENWE